jgi:putative FmdB family regulatory protein
VKDYLPSRLKKQKELPKMPTYEYECEKCGITFERFQSITAEPIKKCPKCGGPVRRLIGAGAGVIFKGSGFYATDYRSESYKRQAEKEKGSGKISEKKTEKESKTAEEKPGKSQ